MQRCDALDVSTPLDRGELEPALCVTTDNDHLVSRECDGLRGDVQFLRPIRWSPASQRRGVRLQRVRICLFTSS